VLLCYGCYLAYQTRNVNPNFAESKYIMFAMYNVLIFGAMALIFIYVLKMETETARLLHALCVCISAIASLLVVNIPKLLRVGLTQDELMGGNNTSATKATSKTADNDESGDNSRMEELKEQLKRYENKYGQLE